VGSDDLVRRRARQLAAEAAAAGEPAGWFETLYAEARAGTAVVPWDDGQANPHLAEWAPGATERAVAGPGRRALVVGCGVCEDPVFLAGLGCEVTAFDLVTEVYTVQALYGKARAAAIEELPALVAPGGTLLVIARATDEEDPVRDPAMMPWPLTRSELESLAGNRLTARSIEKFFDDEDPPKLRWRAEFKRT
jgi:hypothetical protein